MPLHPTHLGTAVLIGFFALAGGEAVAQTAPPAAAPPAGQAPPQGPVRVDLQPARGDWFKACGKAQVSATVTKDVCNTTRDYSTAADQPPVVAFAVQDVNKGEDQTIRFLMPPGLLLQPGIRFAIDKGAQQEGKYVVCLPNGCFAEAKLKTSTTDAMKKGTLLMVLAKNTVNNEITFTLPLSGFGKAFDGPPIDPKVLEQQQAAQQAELQKQLEERAKAQRQSLEQGGAAATPGAPAPKP